MAAAEEALAASEAEEDGDGQGSASGSMSVAQENAARSARSYLDFSGFSRSGLIDQLIFEGYTEEQATYGVDQAGL